MESCLFGKEVQKIEYGSSVGFAGCSMSFNCQLFPAWKSTARIPRYLNIFESPKLFLVGIKLAFIYAPLGPATREGVHALVLIQMFTMFTSWANGLHIPGLYSKLTFQVEVSDSYFRSWRNWAPEAGGTAGRHPGEPDRATGDYNSLRH